MEAPAIEEIRRRLANSSSPRSAVRNTRADWQSALRFVSTFLDNLTARGALADQIGCVRPKLVGTRHSANTIDTHPTESGLQAMTCPQVLPSTRPTERASSHSLVIADPPPATAAPPSMSPNGRAASKPALVGSTLLSRRTRDP